MFFNLRYWFHGISHTESYETADGIAERVKFLAENKINFEMRTANDRNTYP